MIPSGEKPDLVWGLDKIAMRLGISRRTLERLLLRPAGERPPIRKCHRGYYAIDSRLQCWVDAEDMDAGVYRKMRRGVIECAEAQGR